MTHQDLPPSVLRALLQLGSTWNQKGIELLLFGSFATGNARPNSDIDLAFSAHERDDEHLVNSLYAAIDDLPTIRPVDLVDLRHAPAGLARAAKSSGIPLTQLTPV